LSPESARFSRIEAKRERNTDYSLRMTWVLLGSVCALVLTAVAFYHVHGKADLVDAFYMSVITLSTVGFREVVPLDEEGKLFTILYIVLGWLTMVTAGRYAVEYLFEAELGGRWRKKRMSKTLERLSGHTLVCGFGRMGRWAVEALEQRGETVVVVDNDEAKLAERLREGKPALIGDASEDEVLLAAGIERAKALISAANDDATNTLIVLTARSLNPALKIAARASNDQALPKLKKAGADRVLSPYASAGMKLAMFVIAPGAVEFLESTVMGSEYVLQEVVVSPGSELAGKSLLESDLRSKLGLSVLAVKRPSGRWEVVPDPATLIQENDTLVVLGTLSQVKRLLEVPDLVEVEND